MSRRNSGGEDSLFLKLFDYLDKHSDHNDKEILKKIPKIKKAQISNIRANLYKQLLASLRLFHRSNNIDIYLNEQLDYAHVLYDKGLYKSSLDILDKAKTKALEQKQYMMAQNMVEFEKHIESQHITGSMSAKAIELDELSHFLIHRNQKSASLSSASLQLYGLYLRHGYVRNQKDYKYVTEFFEEKLPVYDLEDLDFYEKLYYFQSYVWYSNMCHDFLNYYRYAQRWVNLFHDNPAMKDKELASYIKGLHNLLNALFLAGKYKKFKKAYLELEQFNSDGVLSINRNEESLLVLFKNVHMINLHYMQGSFTECLEMMPELEKIIVSNKYNWDQHRIMVFYYKIACLYFGAVQNENCIHYLNLIINNFFPKVREDIQSFARILNLIAHFELGNELLISYQIKSVYRFLSKMNDLHEVQKEIFKFLRKTPRIEPKNLNHEFGLLRDKLVIIREMPFEKRPFLYLDIIAWLESRIEGVAVEKVIERNFNLLQNENATLG
ncbi:hypothetical protein [Portibacter lacus]|uniref:Uncharacterized protein n=1 Tax=Portibacter lacus TaxID=1099794 RepID=A0AA37SR03_9BACT|nr:hypothetical protein [Portibacter lacus]GLR18114.1 hypothetical protein GCM10007940_27290 [Portibacter lacus]